MPNVGPSQTTMSVTTPAATTAGRISRIATSTSPSGAKMPAIPSLRLAPNITSPVTIAASSAVAASRALTLPTAAIEDERGLYAVRERVREGGRSRYSGPRSSMREADITSLDAAPPHAPLAGRGSQRKDPAEPADRSRYSDRP